jgi:small subunit ribosomal protein S6
MRRYETIIITDPDVGEDTRKALTGKITELMAAEGGFLIKQDDWGVRKLAYEIRKKPRGFYTLFDFCGGGSLVEEMERQFRIDDRVLKFMTVVLDKEADLEAIKAEVAAAKAAAETATAEASPGETSTIEASANEASVNEATPTEAAPPAEPTPEAVTEGTTEAPAESVVDEEVKAQPAETAETESVEKE